MLAVILSLILQAPVPEKPVTLFVRTVDVDGSGPDTEDGRA